MSRNYAEGLTQRELCSCYKQSRQRGITEVESVLNRSLRNENDLLWWKLKFLALTNSSLTITNFDRLRELVSVEYLILSKNELDSIPNLSDLYNLIYLNLSFNQITSALNIRNIVGNISRF